MVAQMLVDKTANVVIAMVIALPFAVVQWNVQAGAG